MKGRGYRRIKYGYGTGLYQDIEIDVNNKIAFNIEPFHQFVQNFAFNRKNSVFKFSAKNNLFNLF